VNTFKNHKNLRKHTIVRIKNKHFYRTMKQIKGILLKTLKPKQSTIIRITNENFYRQM